uniref:Pre-mRNA-splicing factor 18 n=1 Tax=Coccidioides posadasii RMSCC 3488 TaxID=454284 RepID=A0A0J6FE65_COCPO|nr:PRP18 protein [Coccidioides posadasii RMSCC 3488]
MDFASLMSKEIAKSKPPAKQSSQTEQNQQYVRRSELETARVAAEQMQRGRDYKENEKSARELGLSVTPAEENGESGKEQTPLEGEEIVGQEEVVEKLRSLGEPIRLFGESDKGRLKRYRRLVQRSATPQKQLSDGPIPTTLELLPEAEMKVPDKVPEDEEGKKYLFRQLASYFTMVLKEWEIALSKRDDSVKSTFQGRQAYNAMVQSRDNMKPLFKKFENADVEEGILGPIVEIVRNAQNRRYVDANDGYLRLSIGKAAWPIGVTMVGIHERSAREKLHEGGQDKAHIMSDEITRKFLQSIKRCLTFAQVRWPPDDQLQLMG